jgi:hypothetical protein
MFFDDDDTPVGLFSTSGTFGSEGGVGGVVRGDVGGVGGLPDADM